LGKESRTAVLTLPQRRARVYSDQFYTYWGYGAFAWMAYAFRAIFLFLFRRYTAISAKEMLINEDIRVSELRVTGATGETLGIMSTKAALRMADDAGLDLVLIAPQATPPVARIMDYGKYRFECEKREKEAKKKQQVVELKEIQLSCRIDTHDFETKARQARKFLESGNKVRVVMKFKGREMSHQSIGREVMTRFSDALSDIGGSDKPPVLDGRFMSIVLSPLKK
jgi:translation initiation factor IF-3